jgi:hypothetical protein
LAHASERKSSRAHDAHDTHAQAIHVNGQPEEINSTIAGFAGGNVVGILLDTYDPHALGGTGALRLLRHFFLRLR